MRSSTPILKVFYIVSTTCDLCGKRGKKCLEIREACICEDCTHKALDVLQTIKRRITTKKDLA